MYALTIPLININALLLPLMSQKFLPQSTSHGNQTLNLGNVGGSGCIRKKLKWEIVDKPRDENVIGCRWIFSVKHKVDGPVDGYNVRLVANGYSQPYGVVLL